MLQAVPIHHVVPIADLRHETAGRDYFFGSLWIPISNMYFERLGQAQLLGRAR